MESAAKAGEFSSEARGKPDFGAVRLSEVFSFYAFAQVPKPKKSELFVY